MFFWNSLAFFDDPTDAGNLLSRSSAFSKYSLNIYLKVHSSHTVEAWLGEFWALLCQHVRWVQLYGFELSLALPFFEIGMKTDLFQSCGHCWVFQICWHIKCSTFTASSFRIWNSSAGIPSPPLALFIVMLLKSTWLHILGCLALGGDHTIMIIWVTKIFFI